MYICISLLGLMITIELGLLIAALQRAMRAFEFREELLMEESD